MQALTLGETVQISVSKGRPLPEELAALSKEIEITGKVANYCFQTYLPPAGQLFTAEKALIIPVLNGSNRERPFDCGVICVYRELTPALFIRFFSFQSPSGNQALNCNVTHLTSLLKGQQTEIRPASDPSYKMTFQMVDLNEVRNKTQKDTLDWRRDDSSGSDGGRPRSSRKGTPPPQKRDSKTGCIVC